MALACDSKINPRSGFCSSSFIFHSKYMPFSLPPSPFLDATTFISSQPHSGGTAYVDADTGRSLSFSELWRSVDAVAACLSDMGIHKGDVVLILSPNSIFVPVAFLAVISLGAVVTTANPLNTAGEIARQVKDSRPVLAFTFRRLVPELAGSGLRVVLLDEAEKHRGAGAEIVTTLEEMMRTTKPSAGRVKERVHQDDPATLLYSSGTTGPSKGVVCTHRNLIASVLTLRAGLRGPAESRRFLCVVPMSHVYGMAVFVLASPALGSTVVVLPRFGIEEMLSAIERHRVTFLPTVPPIMAALADAAEIIKAKYDLGSLDTVLCGGAPLSKETAESFAQKFPTVAIKQGYAMTESISTGATTAPTEEAQRYGTAGLLTPNTEAKVVDPESGAPLGTNQTGELWLRGPCVMKGYLNNPEATAVALSPEGWLRTGDLCYIDEDGFLFVVERLKELIKYKGYQVPPAELEALLLSHPEISDAAVIPIPDKDVGQYPMAYVVRKADSKVSPGDIMDFVARQVAPYKRIRRVAFIDKIPKTPSGKILRKDLVKIATSKI